MAKATVKEVIKGFIKVRDAVDKMKKQHKEELAPMNEKLELMGAWLQRDLQGRGTESERTTEGTAYLSTVSKATVKDRDALFEFVRENDMYDLLENRVAKSVVEDHLENTGEIVPGVHFTKTQVVRVRR